jgi:hypothetical protein
MRLVPGQDPPEIQDGVYGSVRKASAWCACATWTFARVLLALTNPTKVWTADDLIGVPSGRGKLLDGPAPHGILLTRRGGRGRFQASIRGYLLAKSDRGKFRFLLN